MRQQTHFILKELFERYRLDLQRFIAMKFGDHSSEDITQEAFINILKIEDPSSIENPKAYLYKTAQNLALSRIRREKLHQKYTDDSQHESENEVCLERQIQAQRDLQSVQSALQELPEKYRKTFLLSRSEGLSYKEISEKLEMPVSTVEKHIIKVLKYLRDNLEDIG